MAIQYGVLRGHPDRYKREDNVSTPHLQIRVLEDGGQPWRIAVNVQSDAGANAASNVAFWVVDPLAGHPLLASLPSLSQGFTALARSADHALDYVKAPLFDWTAGRVLPPSGSASSDDLQDLLSLYLDQCKNASGEIYAFGAKFEQNLHKPIDVEFGNTDGLHGIHDIHLNQGNVGAHAGDNGVFHDGGLILSFPDRYLGLFLGFQTQQIPTDAVGNAAPGATTIAQILSGSQIPPTGPTPAAVYIERALINPSGADPGREVVVIGSLATSTQTLTNWRLVDKNARATAITMTIQPGQSALIMLDGKGVQLGNQGGNLILQDQHNAQVDAVTYTVEDASPDNRYVRFRR
ncbi:MAG: DUF2278 family protein [Vicinamibacterales bacterium]